MSELIKSQQRLLKHAGFPCEASGFQKFPRFHQGLVFLWRIIGTIKSLNLCFAQ